MMEPYELYIEAIPKSIQKKGSFKKNGAKKYLNYTQIKQLINLYPDRFNYDLARQFNVSESTILSIRRKYNLKKAPEIMDYARYKKGNISFNKGKHHNHCSATKFKSGHIPKNHKPVGTIDIRKNNRKGEQYLYIKIKEPYFWEPLHRNIWKQNYGEIPEEMIIIFKDGNIMNCDILNLQMISRAENMERNRNRIKAAEKMRELWRREKTRALYGLQRQTKLRIK